ncbi:MAG: UDP-N-acetylmuramoyl-tripeptide--D-alanyl-D-alanine ligase [Myxococcales bacterium]|jgi:UDP-N-acetylmuramoyl-tripeptide--D-alanyl-D-alanine ligase|nr:UDP-N-acetylmuramoyl-tripeptide--D-alanyl-D-alanine ligase [Myxococcales bacterium]
MKPMFSTQEIVQATVAQVRGARVERFSGVSTDTRAIEPGALFLALSGERFDGHNFVADALRKGALGAVVQRGTSVEVPEGATLFEVDDTLTALGQLARLHRRRFSFPIGAITGSNGKTTTKEMIGAILTMLGPSLKTEGNLNNEIGLPRTLFGLAPEQKAAIVEMGMNHPGELARLVAIAEPTCAAITCVGAAHLEGLKSVNAVAEAKGEIFQGLPEGALAVVNVDDVRVVAQAQKSGRRQLTFGRAERADVRLASVQTLRQGGLAITIAFDGREWPVALNFIGAHNAQNACCAFAMGIALGASPEQCAAGLAAARGVEHRLSLVELPFGGMLIDDCYNANPASMTAGLQTLVSLGAARQATPLAAVLGDMLELGSAEVESHRALGKQAAALGVRFLVTVGPRSVDTWREFVAAAPDRRAIALPNPDDLSEGRTFLKATLGKNALLLVKGSRGMRLERLVADLTERPKLENEH